MQKKKQLKTVEEDKERIIKSQRAFYSRKVLYERKNNKWIKRNEGLVW